MEGIECGEVQPLPSTTFARHELQEAIRYMSKGGCTSEADRLTLAGRADAGQVLHMNTHGPGYPTLVRLTSLFLFSRHVEGNLDLGMRQHCGNLNLWTSRVL